MAHSDSTVGGNRSFDGPRWIEILAQGVVHRRDANTHWCETHYQKNHCGRVSTVSISNSFAYSINIYMFIHLARLGHSDDKFREEYPDVDKNIRSLLAAIRIRTAQPRNSKNGTPEERRSRSIVNDAR